MKTGTVLFVSHDTGAVVNLCSKAVLLNQGLVVEIGKPKDVTAHYLATLYASNQEVDGVRAKGTCVPEIQAQSQGEYRDMREALINSSTLRNDIEVFQFKPDEAGFGTGDAEIIGVRLLDQVGSPLSWIVGGEDVILEVRCLAHKDIIRPIVGFQFKDRLGQVVFADNTFIAYEHNPHPVAQGDEFFARFEFRLPVLPTGDYSIGAALADGSQNSHAQHHWIHDALIVRVHASSVCFGLVGVPMKQIILADQ